MNLTAGAIRREVATSGGFAARRTPCKGQRLPLEHGRVIRSVPTMLDAAFKALAQMFTPPFRSVLLKSAGLALALLAVVVIVLHRLVFWLTGAGEHWAEGALGATAHEPLRWLGWLVVFALGSGLVAGAVVLMPAVTALVASFFTDEIAGKVEESHYPLDPPGVIVPLPRAILEGIKIAALSIVV